MIDLDAYEQHLSKRAQAATLLGATRRASAFVEARNLLRAMRAAALPDPSAPSLPVMHAAPTTQAMRAKALPRSGTLRAQIVDLLDGYRTGGLTDDAMEVWFARSHQSVSAARNGLVKDGWMTAATWSDGEPQTRVTRSGNPAQVWRLTDTARRALGAKEIG